MYKKDEKRLNNEKKVLKQESDADISGNSFFSEDFCIALDNTVFPIYIIDPESFQVLYCNKAMCRYLGRNPFGSLCHKVMRGLDAPCEDCTAMRLYRHGDNAPREYQTPQGIWVLLQASPLSWKGRDFIQITCVNISRPKKLESELRLLGKEYGAVARQSTAGILRYDIGTGTASINVDSSLNRVEEYVIPNYIQVLRDSGIIEKESLPVVKAMFDDIYGGRSSRGYDLQLVLPQGETKWCHLDYSLIEDDDGCPYRAVVSFYDNTQQREREIAYQHWHTRLKAIMDEYTAYMGVDLSEDLIETENRIGSWDQDVGGLCFSEAVRITESDRVFEDDRCLFRNFFNRERLMGQFLAGNLESFVEYRIVKDGEAKWHKAELQMVSDPASGHVKASIVISNVDVDLRERERLTRKAERDVMTGLYNHATAETLIREVLEQETEESCCFLIIDLDDLRNINGSLGHPEGDRAIVIIADCMKSYFGETNILGRLGGDEFVALLRNVEKEKLYPLLSGFLRKINENYIGPQQDWPVHVSVGGAMGETGMDDFKNLYRQADLALYYTKAMGKNNFSLYEPELEKREFSYTPQGAATLETLDAFDSVEFKKLLQALSTYFPMVISVNLTKNTYYMMEYRSYTMQKHQIEGNFDRLVEDGAESFHPDDRESFLKSFSRESLLKAYERGEKVVRHIGRQLGDDGVYRMTQGVVIFVNDENSGDVCEITFSHAEITEGRER